MSKKYGDIETHIYSKSLNVHCIVGHTLYLHGQSVDR